MAEFFRKPPAIALLILLAAGGLYAAATWGGRGETYVSPLIAESLSRSGILSKDSDADGLADWEEELWKTDPQNPDTDGDGTKDGEEIKTGRNPLRPGPNDRLDLQTIEKKVNLETESDLTETEKLSRLLFARYVGALRQGKKLSETDIQNLLGEIEKGQSAPVRAFTEENIMIGASDDAAAWRAYGNAAGEIIVKNSPRGAEPELTIFERATNANDEKELDKLDPVIAGYRGIVSDLLTLPVPASFAKEHLAFVNASDLLQKSIQGMRQIFTDPLGAALGLTAYLKNADAFIAARNALGAAFLRRGIDFSGNEYGFVFTKR